MVTPVGEPGKSPEQKKQSNPQSAQPVVQTNPKPDAPVKPAEANFPVVALGASAGGLEAFTQFLSKVPSDSGMAFIFIQHLDPSHPSSLAELLSRKSPMPIAEAAENARVQPNRAYIIPPGKGMSIANHTLRLQEQREHPGLTHNINLFFQSLAEDVKERAVGIILSGTGSDGKDGARAIKAQQGLVIVQDPQTARYDGMPTAAIEAGVADYILPPEAMPDKLKEYLSKSSYSRDQIRQSLQKDEGNLKSIFALVKTRTGRDFSNYKISSIHRRIEHRMAVNQIETLKDYLRLLNERPAEIEELMKDFLIQVTSFFRDQEAFESLKQAVNQMLQNKAPKSPLRAWVPACSTGEEAYSIAIVLLECMEERGRQYELQVFGTDLDSRAISAARAGIYPSTITQDVSPERLKRFFRKVDDSYQIEQRLRERATFAVHDLITDPPYSRVDLVSVRNLLIYFDTALQKKVLPILHYSLNPDGLLFLGTSETIGDFSDLITAINVKGRISPAVRNQPAPQPNLFRGVPDLPASGPVRLLDSQTPEVPPSDQALLLKALPPSILVDRNRQLLYTHGDTSKYLRMPEGKPSSDILRLVKPDLDSVLTTLLEVAMQDNREAVSENLNVKYDGIDRLLKIIVRPLKTLEGQLVITFEDLPMAKARKLKGKSLTDIQHRDLEEELRHTRDTLRGTIEELKTANEELRSANEEYQSTNEELKSANEELETSREELQSVNEELTTLNAESQRKNEDLNSVNNDMYNLLNATGIASVFLDLKLRIRRFTPAASKLFNFIESDIGRPLENISSPLKDNILSRAANQVLENLIPVEQEVQTTDGHWYSLRIIPYRTLENAIAGVVVSFLDISRIKAAQQYAEDIISNIREPLLILDNQSRVVSASRAFYQIFQVKPEDTEGQLFFELGNRQWDIPQLRQILKEVLEKDKTFEGYQVEHDFPGIGHRVMVLNARRIIDRKATDSILLAMEDITGRSRPEPFAQKTDTRDKKVKE